MLKKKKINIFCKLKNMYSYRYLFSKVDIEFGKEDI